MFFFKRKRGPGRPRGSKSKKENEDHIFPQDHEEVLEKITPEIIRNILAVLLVLVSLIIGLSFFNLAGPMGRILFDKGRLSTGYLYFFLPVVFLTLAVFLFKPQNKKPGIITYIGLLLLILSLAGLFHFFGGQTTFTASRAGGGYFGYAVRVPLEKAAGPIATGLILTAIWLSAVMITFNLNLKEVLNRPKRFWQKATRPVHSLKFNFKRGQVRTENEEILEDKEIEPDTAPLASEGQQIEAEVEQIRLPLESDQAKTIAIFKPRRKWILPPLKLLNKEKSKPDSGDVQARAKIIQDTLSDFGIEVKMTSVNVGPTVTQYALKPAQGVKLRQITTLHNDLALALASHPIRIEAPIPGKSLVGVEVPNEAIALVGLREILDSKEFKQRKSNLAIALGKDVAGEPVVANLKKMPHLLIAGATGSGKSVCINAILLSLLYENSPRNLKIILVDPKRVEMSLYNNIPHLLTPVVIETDKTVNALRWAVEEMERRYRLLSEAAKRDIDSYNQSGSEEHLNYIVIIIDELADLMSVAPNDVEAAIVRLAQMARAVGIHLIVATQRPSVNVITGLIKANITTRIAFSVASQIDSRTIIDEAGAEKLLGSGDMLYKASDEVKPRRIQGALVREDEVQRVTSFLKQQAEPDYKTEVVEKKGGNGFVGSLGEVDDNLFEEAKELVISTGKASASFLQRRLRVGYARAARILDFLEEQGIIGQQEGSKPREVLVAPDQLESSLSKNIPIPNQPDENLDQADDFTDEASDDQIEGPR